MSKFVKETDLGWDKIKTVAKKTNGSYTKVGIQQGAKHTSKKAKKTLDLVEIATVNEFGSKDGKIPARPALRNAITKNQNQIKTISKNLYGRAILGEIPLEKSLGLLGEFVTAKMKSSITQLKTPANSAKTIKRKKSSNPLIDTGQYRSAISHVEVLR